MTAKKVCDGKANPECSQKNIVFVKIAWFCLHFFVLESGRAMAQWLPPPYATYTFKR